MRLLAIAIFSVFIFYVAEACKPAEPKPEKRILVFSLTKGYHHASIKEGNEFFTRLGIQHGFVADTTTNPALFTLDNLKKYRSVVWLSTTGDVLNAEQQAAFEKYIQHGGGYVGIHAASDTEYDWPWYGKLVGAYFVSHPAIQEAKIVNLDKSFPATAFLPDSFSHKDEFYDFKSVNTEALHFLLRVDEQSYQGGKMGSFHPMAWYHEYDGGRAFYSNFGHTPETFSDSLFAEHFWKGLEWTMHATKK
ncbi:cytochrome c/hypothetical protein [Filimonas lacunae]|uniref:ThuA-like domain-containing protein n=1 Tax=Filimonas lacunae TaxID=477680 RepID=A0A173MJ00_9BACT|nr:ThuA domain-containing protein [Filimonas lacunae]BAV07447.1 cytochrome c551/c552 [Filimonas lacunae]SIT30336.1 cytochrome c/hypothetical protein [Filimonas lacunae]